MAGDLCRESTDLQLQPAWCAYQSKLWGGAQAARANAAMLASREARRFSDDYVLLTVIFASVLFFGGIARAFDSRLLRIVLGGLSVLFFLGTMAALGTMPICHE